MGLPHHSDQAHTRSHFYQRLLHKYGVTSSTSRRENRFDNAAVESFFSTVTREVVDRFVSFGEDDRRFSRASRIPEHRGHYATLVQIRPAAFEWRTAQAA